MAIIVVSVLYFAIHQSGVSVFLIVWFGVWVVLVCILLYTIRGFRFRVYFAIHHSGVLLFPCVFVTIHQ